MNTVNRCRWFDYWRVNDSIHWWKIGVHRRIVFSFPAEANVSLLFYCCRSNRFCPWALSERRSVGQRLGHLPLVDRWESQRLRRRGRNRPRQRPQIRPLAPPNSCGFFQRWVWRNSRMMIAPFRWCHRPPVERCRQRATDWSRRTAHAFLVDRIWRCYWPSERYARN